MMIGFNKDRHELLIHLASLWLADCNNTTTGGDPLNLTELQTTILKQRVIERKTIRAISETVQLSIGKTRQLLYQGIYALRTKYDPHYFEISR